MKNPNQIEISCIEDELRNLNPRVELAYMDYLDNTGSGEYADWFFKEYDVLRKRWNELVRQRKALLDGENI